MGEQLTMSQYGPLRAASNNPAQLADRTYAFDACARNMGLCPHKQNHPLGGWMLIHIHTRSVFMPAKYSDMSLASLGLSVQQVLTL